MGGGPDKEHMVIALWSAEPTAIVSEIKRRFPYIDITYLNLSSHDRSPKTMSQPSIPPEVYQSATIWVTLGVLPPQPRDVPKLKLIHLFSAGVDHYARHPILTDSDIPITTSSGISAPPIAEWVLMTTLAMTKHFTTTYEWQKAHQWGPPRGGPPLPRGSDWVGKRVGVAGYGSIGRQVARLLTALGANIIAYTASPRDTAAARRDGGYAVPGTGDPEGTFPIAWHSGTSRAALHVFLRQRLDLLVVCLPLTAATTRLFGREEWEVLAEGSLTGGEGGGESPTGRSPTGGVGGPLVANISRGRILDQPALVAALNEGVLGGAMLDVADPEPLPEGDPLWTARNVLITPHVSASGEEYTARAYEVLMANLARRERGERMFNLVDRRKGY